MSEIHGTSGQVNMYETEAERLQREADLYTKKLEHERKRYLILEDQYKQKMKELEEIKDKIKENISDEKAEHEAEVKRLSLHHRLRNQKVLLNDTIGDNQDLKNNIDIMRKEISFAKSSIKTMRETIYALMDRSTNANTDAVVQGRTASETNNQILALKAKHEEGKEVFELEIKKLQERLKERDEPIEFNDKSITQMQDSKTPGDKKSSFANPVEILKIRLKQVTNKNKEKKKLLDQYVRNAKIIEEAFETIQDATGITNIDEIVTTFIKAEEQNYSLYNYVDQLNQETDNLEAQGKFLDQEIDRYEEMSRLNQGQMRQKINEMSEEAEMLRDQILTSNEQSEGVQADFLKIQNTVKNLAGRFNEAGFKSTVATPMEYDEHTSFSEQNIVQYLAEVEEYISSLITYVAQKQGDPNPSISSVPIELLTKKDHFKQPLSIDAPTDIRTDPVDEEEATIDKGELYKRFVNGVEKGRITFVKSGKARDNRDD